MNDSTTLQPLTWSRFSQNHSLYLQKEQRKKSINSEIKKMLNVMSVQHLELLDDLKNNKEKIEVKEKLIVDSKKGKLNEKLLVILNRIYILVVTSHAYCLVLFKDQQKYLAYYDDLNKVFDQLSNHFEKGNEQKGKYPLATEESFKKLIDSLIKKFPQQVHHNPYYDYIISNRDARIPDSIKWLIDNGIEIKDLDKDSIAHWRKAINEYENEVKKSETTKIGLLLARASCYLDLFTELESEFLKKGIQVDEILLKMVKDVYLYPLTKINYGDCAKKTPKDVFRLLKTSVLIDQKILGLCQKLHTEKHVKLSVISEIIISLSQDRQTVFFWYINFFDLWKQDRSKCLEVEQHFIEKNEMWNSYKDVYCDRAEKSRKTNNYTATIFLNNITNRFFITGGKGIISESKRKYSCGVFPSLNEIFESCVSVSEKNKLSRYSFKYIAPKESQWLVIEEMKKFLSPLISKSTYMSPKLFKESSDDLCFDDILKIFRARISYLENNRNLTKNQRQLLIECSHLYVKGELSKEQSFCRGYKVDENQRPFEIGKYDSLNQYRSLIPVMYWGSLIQEEPSWWKTLKELVGLDFQSQMDNMQKEVIDKLKFKQDRIDEKGNLKDSEEAMRVKVLQLTQYQMIMNRVIDVLSEKQREVQRNCGPNEPRRIILEGEIDVLNKAFDHFFQLHKSIKPPETSLWWKCLEFIFIHRVADMNINYLWGFNFFKHVPSEEFELWKLCADKGYNFVGDLQDLLKFLFNTEGGVEASIISIISKIKSLAEEFVRFAEETQDDGIAELMFANFYISVFPFFNDDREFLKHLTTLTGIHLFYKALFKTFQHKFTKKSIRTEHLKFFALSRLANLLPYLTGTLVALKNILQKNFEPSMAWVLNSTVEMLKGIAPVFFFQQISEALSKGPDYLTDLVNVFLKVIQGDSMNDIFELHSRLATVRVAAELWRAFQNPQRFKESVRIEASLWFKTISHAKTPLEIVCRIVVQIICPIAAVLVARGVFFAVILTGGVWVAIPLLIGTLALGLTLTIKAYSIINFFYPDTRNKLEEEMFKTSKEVDLLCRQQVGKLTQQYIEDLKKAKSVPDVSKQIDTTLKETLSPVSKKWVEKMEKELNEQEHLYEFKNPKDYCRFFTDKVKLDDLRLRIEKEEDLKNEMSYQATWMVVDALEKDWLFKRVEKKMDSKFEKEALAKANLEAAKLEESIMNEYSSEVQEVVKDRKKMPEFVKSKIRKEISTAGKDIAFTDKEFDHLWKGYMKMTSAT